MIFLYIHAFSISSKYTDVSCNPQDKMPEANQIAGYTAELAPDRTSLSSMYLHANSI